MKKQLVFELTKNLFVCIKDQIKSNQHNFYHVFLLNPAGYVIHCNHKKIY